MNYNEIIRLLDAGYSREEIMAMNENETETSETESPTTPETVETETPETGMTELVKEMRDAFAEMKKEFTAFNIMSSRQPEEKTPEDIIANIINPTRTKKGEK